LRFAPSLLVSDDEITDAVHILETVLRETGETEGGGA
jgi:acetylornithine/succinyldiaminopimelate/putrescine aminotransferase